MREGRETRTEGEKTREGESPARSREERAEEVGVGLVCVMEGAGEREGDEPVRWRRGGEEMDDGTRGSCAPQVCVRQNLFLSSQSLDH